MTMNLHCIMLILHPQHNHHHFSLHLKELIKKACYETPRTVENHRAGYYYRYSSRVQSNLTYNNYIIPTFVAVPIPIVRL